MLKQSCNLTENKVSFGQLDEFSKTVGGKLSWITNSNSRIKALEVCMKVAWSYITKAPERLRCDAFSFKLEENLFLWLMLAFSVFWKIFFGFMNFEIGFLPFELNMVICEIMKVWMLLKCKHFKSFDIALVINSSWI